jgi:hypothetical protein
MTLVVLQALMRLSSVGVGEDRRERVSGHQLGSTRHHAPGQNIEWIGFELTGSGDAECRDDFAFGHAHGRSDAAHAEARCSPSSVA